MKYIYIIIFITSLFFLQSQSTSWYFSTSTGSDFNNGTSPTSPWKSSKRLWELLVAGNTFTINNTPIKFKRGDKVYFLKGDTFHIPFFSGNKLINGLYFNVPEFKTNGNDSITFSSYGNSTYKPVLKGSMKLSDMPGINNAVLYQLNNGKKLVKIPKLFGNIDSVVVGRLFYKSNSMILARYPDIPFDNQFNGSQADFMLVVESSKSIPTSTPGVISSEIVSFSINPSYAAGARIWYTSVGFSWYASKVAAVNGKTLITLPNQMVDPIDKGNRYYLENKKEFLNNNGEWYFDENNDTLLFILPQGVSTFNPNDFEVQLFSCWKGGKHVDLSRIFSCYYTATLNPSDPINKIQFLNLKLMCADRAISMAGVKDIRIHNCEFEDFNTGIDIYLGLNILIENNVFRNIEMNGIHISGCRQQGLEGNPGAMTQSVTVKSNTIQCIGLGRKWNSEYYLLGVPGTYYENNASVSHIEVGILFRFNLNDVVIEKNVIDSISHSGINGYNFIHGKDSLFNSLYAGNRPVWIKNNYITNSCMDFSDCGGIYVGMYLNNSLIENNIIYKSIYGRSNRLVNKKWLNSYRYSLTGFGGNGYGLYTDVETKDVILKNNTVIGGDSNFENFPGSGLPNGGGRFMENILSVKNTFYAGLENEAVFTSVNHVHGYLKNCKLNNNIFFHVFHGRGAVYMSDISQNNKKDTINFMDDNRYFLPSSSPAYIYQDIINYDFNKVKLYSFSKLKENTSYEKSANSYWAKWSNNKYSYDLSLISGTSMVTDPSLSSPVNSTIFPVWAYGSVTIQPSTHPLLGNCIKAICTNTGGIIIKSNQPFFNDTLYPYYTSNAYKINLIGLYNDNNLEVRISGTSLHTGLTNYTLNTINVKDYLSLPFKKNIPDTFNIRLFPRVKQWNNSLYIKLKNHDTLYLKYLNVIQFDSSHIKPINYYFPIFYNASDNIKIFNLPNCHYYLDTDSNLVFNSLSVQPWESRILILMGCDSTIGLNKYIQSDNTFAYLYPNPVKNHLNLLCSTSCEFELFDINGKKIDNGYLLAGKNIYNVSRLLVGIYFLKLIRKNHNGKYEQKTFKFIKN